MAGESDHRASDLGPPVHLAGLPALRCSAHPGVPKRGEVDPAGVRLFCSYHPDHGGVWRLCRRYTHQSSIHRFPNQGHGEVLEPVLTVSVRWELKTFILASQKCWVSKAPFTPRDWTAYGLCDSYSMFRWIWIQQLSTSFCFISFSPILGPTAVH